MKFYSFFYQEMQSKDNTLDNVGDPEDFHGAHNDTMYHIIHSMLINFLPCLSLFGKN